MTNGSTAYWNGATWTDKGGGTFPPPRAIWGASATDAWTVGEKTMHWDGATWSNVVGLPDTLIDVRGASANDVTAIATFNGSSTLYHWDGAVWSQLADSFVAAGQHFSMVSPKDIWSAGPSVDHWDGKCWRRLTTGQWVNSRPSAIGATSGRVFLISGPETFRLDRGP